MCIHKDGSIRRKTAKRFVQELREAGFLPAPEHKSGGDSGVEGFLLKIQPAYADTHVQVRFSLGKGGDYG